MNATIEAPKKPEVSWRDFTLEEHIRAFVGVPEFCVCRIKSVIGGRYFRVNVIDVSNERFVKSVFLKVIETPEGYIIEDHTHAKEEETN